MYVMVEENPNCDPEERMFSSSGQPKTVGKLYLEPMGRPAGWWEVASVDEAGSFSSASAVQVEDSSAGSAWLIFGGAWGLRFRPEGSTNAWSTKDSSQWGVPFLVLDTSTLMK
jgi:hypothetical protein